jgi:hypothetical protein
MPRSKHSAFARVIPAGYMVYLLRLEGETPLLMSSPESDRWGDTYKAFRTLSRKRGKTPSDEERLRELEFYVRIYHDEKFGCYIPGRNIKELLRDAATKIKKGEDIRRSLIVPEYRIPLLYDGPRALELRLGLRSRRTHSADVYRLGPRVRDRVRPRGPERRRGSFRRRPLNEVRARRRTQSGLRPLPADAYVSPEAARVGGRERHEGSGSRGRSGSG